MIEDHVLPREGMRAVSAKGYMGRPGEDEKDVPRLSSGILCIRELPRVFLVRRMLLIRCARCNPSAAPRDLV